MLPQETKLWLDRIFNSTSLSSDELKAAIIEMTEAKDLSLGHQFLYELAKRNSEAAFLFSQIELQRKLEQLCGKKGLIIYHSLFPQIHALDDLYFLQAGNIFKIVSPQFIVHAQAFQFLKWIHTDTVKGFAAVGSYDQKQFDKLIEEETIAIAVIVAGIKHKAYQLARVYADERIQGGKLVKDWSMVQLSLVNLYLTIKQDEALVGNINLAGAYAILRNADTHVSSCMQVFGGAGYMEDYIVERLYREIFFLKNWPKPFLKQMKDFFEQQITT